MSTVVANAPNKRSAKTHKSKQIEKWVSNLNFVSGFEIKWQKKKKSKYRYRTFWSCQGHDYPQREDQRAFAPPPGKSCPLPRLQVPEFQYVSEYMTQVLYVKSFSYTHDVSHIDMDNTETRLNLYHSYIGFSIIRYKHINRIICVKKWCV